MCCCSAYKDHDYCFPGSSHSMQKKTEIPAQANLTLDSIGCRTVEALTFWQQFVQEFISIEWNENENSLCPVYRYNFRREFELVTWWNQIYRLSPRISSHYHHWNLMLFLLSKMHQTTCVRPSIHSSHRPKQSYSERNVRGIMLLSSHSTLDHIRFWKREKPKEPTDKKW